LPHQNIPSAPNQTVGVGVEERVPAGIADEASVVATGAAGWVIELGALGGSVGVS
jgi:hypothetical protein